jgi:hypothetical protein
MGRITIWSSITTAEGSVQHLDFLDENSAWLTQFPDAAGFLLPPAKDAEEAEEFNDRAYQSQLFHDLRMRRSPEEFVRAQAFQKGATPYFEVKKAYDDLTEQAKSLPPRIRSARQAELDAKWQSWKEAHLAWHPVFAEELSSSEGKARRGRVLDQLRIAVQDPGAPQPWHLPQLRQLVDSFDNYQSMWAQVADDRSQLGRQRREQIRTGFQSWGEQFVSQYPRMSNVWTTLIEPEIR